MPVLEEIQTWVKKTEEDYEVAISLVRKRRRPVPSAVCFHCQQCVEKYLKAILVGINIRFPRTHDLAVLLELCLPCVASLEAIRDDLAALNPYSVQLRYPGFDATQEEAKIAVQTMKGSDFRCS